MVSEAEFDRVQLLLGRRGKPTPKAHRFPFTGLVRCGECYSMVTAEAKYQIICPACKTKFSATNRDSCPRCHLEIAEMKSARRLHYTYYHCTKYRDRTCSQRSTRAEELERQVDQLLARIAISEDFKQWAIKALHEQHDNSSDAQQEVEQSLQERRRQLGRQLEHINALILSPDTDWTLISHEEVKQSKLALLAELQDAEAQLASSEDHIRNSLELTERTFEFAAYARFWFREGDGDQKRAILSALGSNLTLKDKALRLELQRPLQWIADMTVAAPSGTASFEPACRRANKAKSPTPGSRIPVWCPVSRQTSNLGPIIQATDRLVQSQSGYVKSHS